MASRNTCASTLAIGPGPTAVKAPSIASSGRWSIQLMGHSTVAERSDDRDQMTSSRISALLRRPRLLRQTGIGHIVRIEPSRIGPAVFVVFGHALVGERRHLLERAGRARIPQRLDADILVVAGVIALVKLMTSAEFGAD